MTDIKKRIEKEAVEGKSDWLEKAKSRRENRSWLRKSQSIAIRVLSTIKERGSNQEELAEALDVSPQQVSKIVKGKQNLTLKTISKLEQVLDISLIEIPRPRAQNIVKSTRGKDVTYTNKSRQTFTKSEPLKDVANGSWNPKEERQSNLELV